MVVHSSPVWDKWDQALSELEACNNELRKAREGGNPVAIARSWSSIMAAEARLNEIANRMGPQLDAWLSGMLSNTRTTEESN